MQVILNKDVDHIGKVGSVLKVKDGFARNFLIPKGLAVQATEGNLRKLEEGKKKRAIQLEKAKKEAEEIKAKLANLSLTITVLTHEEGTLYGNITSQEVSRALKDEGFDIDKGLITLDSPISSLGIYEILVKLHPEVTTKLKIWVVKK